MRAESVLRFLSLLDKAVEEGGLNDLLIISLDGLNKELRRILENYEFSDEDNRRYKDMNEQ